MDECKCILVLFVPVGSDARLSDYVDQTTALAKNLTYASGDHFVIRADHTTTLSASGPGRMPVRLQSNKMYQHQRRVFDRMYKSCEIDWVMGDSPSRIRQRMLW